MNRRLLFLTLLSMSLLSYFGMVSAHALEIGDAAPTLTATDQDGKSINFAEVYRQGITLVYFYPKADTPGCTAEACSLRDSYADLRAKGVQVIGVSEDKADAQKKFQEKYQLPFPLIADSDGAVAKAFGVPTLMGMAKRQSFLVNKNQIAWRDLNVSPKTQAQDVRTAVEKLGVK